MTSLALQNNGKKAAIVSFIGGVLIFLLYYFTGSDNLAMAGIAWALLAALLNLVLLTLVLIKAFKDREQSKKLLRTAGLMLLNIPVAFVLFWLGFILATTMRVTIVNSTGKDITDVMIDGCESKHFRIIKAGESETVWITPQSDCAVIMTYKQETNKRSEAVVSYLARGMGGKITHIVGTSDISGT